MANQVRSDFGKTEVTFVKIPASDGGFVAARLYRPKYATAENKLPAVLTVHGGNNDKDTQAPAAIELSRRGFVVLAPDMSTHGDTTIGVNASKAAWGVDIAFDYVKTLPYVDATRIGITGHSRGGRMSVNTAKLKPEHWAIVPQDACDQKYSSEMHNYLCILAAWETKDDGKGGRIRHDEWFFTPAFYEGYYGFKEPIEANKVYGDFKDGTAFMIAVNPTTHPGMPPSNQMITTLVDWMRNALKEGAIDQHWIPAVQHIYVWYDVFMGLALLAALGSVVPLANILLATPFFAKVAQPMPKKYVAKNKDWWRMALINALIAGITYPFLTEVGWMGSWGQWFQKTFPFLKLTHPNGLLAWMIVNAIIFAVLFFFWYRKNSKNNKITMYDMGMSFDEKKTKFEWGVLGKTFLLAVLLVGWLYLLVSISQATLGIEFRVEYPTLKTFADTTRIGQFFIYLIPVLIFMLLNNGVFLFGQARLPEYGSEGRTQLIWWLKNIFASLTFLIVILLLQNIPIMVFNTKYGYDLIGLTAWSKSVGNSVGAGGEWMMAIVLWFLIPLMMLMTFFLNWFFRKSGKIYLGSAFAALIVTWVWAVGNNLIQ